jgi:hypothetical protein
MFNNVNRKLIIYYMPTFRVKSEVKKTRVKSGFHEGLGAKNHWNFRRKEGQSPGKSLRVHGWAGKQAASQPALRA